MHVLPLGNSEWLKECAMERLRDPSLTTKSMRPGTTSKSLPSVRHNIILQLNMILSTVQKDLPGYATRVDFSQICGSSKTDAICRHHGPTGMLEVSGLAFVDNLSTFLCAIVDHCCGEVPEAPITRILAYYTTMVRFLYQKMFSLVGMAKP